MLSINELAVIGSEVILSLYPILVKSINVNLPTQIFARLLSFTGASGTIASKEDWMRTWGTSDAIKKSLFIGAITCLHIYVSYVAFSSLSAGVAMSLFYTYPIWNLLGAQFILGETIHQEAYKYIALGILGTFFLTTRGINDEIHGFKGNQSGALIGVAAALGAALTESAMYFAVKTTDQSTPWSATLSLYGGALVWMIPIILFKIVKISFSWSTWIPIILFNLIVGFAGYALRFYAIPNVKTEIFGLLSFGGVLASFFFGFVFLKEYPSAWSLVGAILVAYAASYIESIKKDSSPKDPSTASPQPVLPVACP